jgi:hypothetical protein
MFELEAFIDCQEDVKPALSFRDENAISLASPSQISDGLPRHTVEEPSEDEVRAED